MRQAARSGSEGSTRGITSRRMSLAPWRLVSSTDLCAKYITKTGLFSNTLLCSASPTRNYEWFCVDFATLAERPCRHATHLDISGCIWLCLARNQIMSSVARLTALMLAAADSEEEEEIGLLLHLHVHRLQAQAQLRGPYILAKSEDMFDVLLDQADDKWFKTWMRYVICINHIHQLLNTTQDV